MKYFPFWCRMFGFKSHCKLAVSCIWYKWQGLGSGEGAAGAAFMKQDQQLPCDRHSQFQAVSTSSTTDPQLAIAEPVSKAGGRKLIKGKISRIKKEQKGQSSGWWSMAEQVRPRKSLWPVYNPHQSRYFSRRSAAHGGLMLVRRKQEGRSSRRQRNENKAWQKETVASWRQQPAPPITSPKGLRKPVW